MPKHLKLPYLGLVILLSCSIADAQLGSPLPPQPNAPSPNGPPPPPGAIPGGGPGAPGGPGGMAAGGPGQTSQLQYNIQQQLRPSGQNQNAGGQNFGNGNNLNNPLNLAGIPGGGPLANPLGNPGGGPLGNPLGNPGGNLLGNLAGNPLAIPSFNLLGNPGPRPQAPSQTTSFSGGTNNLVARGPINNLNFGPSSISIVQPIGPSTGLSLVRPSPVN